MPDPELNNPIIIVFGVSGSGKTTIAKLLAARLHVPYYDADDFHPQSNVEKMRSGIALTDADRMPWLQTLANQLEKWEHERSAILACSALKEQYRKILASQVARVQWVLLTGTFDCIKSRLAERQGHFMSTALLQSQFDTLEIPDYGLKIDIAQTPEEIVNEIVTNLQS